MKTMKMVILALMTAASAQVWAHGETPGVVTIGKAAELAVHRIDRLVVQKKADALFGSNLQTLKLERVTDGSATYKVTALTEPGSNQQTSSIVIALDEKGKVLGQPLISEAVLPANPVQWPALNSVHLIEEALHLIVERREQFPELKPFDLGLMTLTLHAVSHNGVLQAHFVATSDDDPRTLTILLNVDGSYVSHSIQ